MSGLRQEYDPQASLPATWDRFATNLIAIQQPQLAAEMRQVIDTPHVPRGYVDELYPFDAVAYVRNLTARLNQLIIPSADSAINWSGSNLTSHTLYLSRRGYGTTLGQEAGALTGYLNSTYNIAPNKTPGEWDNRVALDGEMWALSQAVTRLGSNGDNMRQPVWRLFYLTARRRAVLATVTTPLLPDPKVADLFSRVETAMYGLMYG